jgi:bifunctional NMN adenylyltransferase/nudix hydrolase
MTTPEIAVLIGRFQPFHNGHVGLLQMALATAPKVVIVLGSSLRARNCKNPFTWQERAGMIRASLSPENAERVAFLPMRDYFDDTRWARAVQKALAEQHGNPQHIALIGHFKDASSQYLNLFPHWKLIAAERQHPIDATRIRQLYLEADDLDVSLQIMQELVPVSIAHYLKAWAILPHYAELAEEHRNIRQYKLAWRNAPYPPIFSTVDALVKTNDHVLLIKRADCPGKGLWALPGGFVEQHERLLQACLRELTEETELAVLQSSLQTALRDVKVFDHPERSLRGRTITHVHFFDLGSDHFPDIRGGDDAASAAWVPIAQLAGMEAQFFDDHFHILDHFLQLTDHS